LSGSVYNRGMAKARQRMIGFVGAPSTGKTTLARAVANAVGLKGLSVEFVTEYARTYIQRFGALESVREQLVIFDTQARREDDARSTGAAFVVAETPVFTGYAYGLEKMRPTAKDQEALQVLHRWILPRLALYDRIYYLPIELPLQQDGTRSETEETRRILDSRLRASLELWAPSYITVRGELADRMQVVIETEFPREAEH